MLCRRRTIPYMPILLTLLSLTVPPPTTASWFRNGAKEGVGRVNGRLGYGFEGGDRFMGSGEGEGRGEDVEDMLDVAFRGHLTREARLAIEQAGSKLQLYESKPGGCFKHAVASVKKGCEMLHVHEIEKVRYAVDLTLCEIATGNIPIPASCQAESYQTDVYGCVEMLSHVPQLWTSYSGYLREVVNICFAIQYESHQSHISQLFENVTLQQITNLRLLVKHRREMKVWHGDEMGRLSALEGLQRVLVERAGEIEVGVNCI
ncbi:uncharacterized protein EV422DRAFT_347748 [Fimicolochytrium jonesii]|uniref:uncharacterized protein n=1 Tax=Fimicolochytrium jonesii TaxID=1396493 RepID=UPI0022FDE228|nr:uncharacterized protein EV422DRAFT_347748 [Fimicolochytrium jonesii]KAI8815662.1 hypothetical protein EV422DRAFT_347748 [Fimicolochytrium jonesii]